MGKQRDELEQMLKEQLDGEALVNVARGINAYDGSFDETDYYDFEDAAQWAESAYEFGRSIVYGDVTNIMEPVRYNAYGNLENVSEYQVKQEIRERIGDIAEWLLINGADEVEDELPNDIVAFVESHRGEV